MIVLLLMLIIKFSTRSSQGEELSKGQQEYFKDSKKTRKNLPQKPIIDSFFGERRSDGAGERGLFKEKSSRTMRSPRGRFFLGGPRKRRGLLEPFLGKGGATERVREGFSKKSRRKRCGACDDVERVMGIEPTRPAWKAGILPLNYTRDY